MTPYEVYLVCRSRGESLEQWHAIAAWHVAHVLNLFVGKGEEPVTPAALLGKRTVITSNAELRLFGKRQFMLWVGMKQDAIEAELEGDKQP